MFGCASLHGTNPEEHALALSYLAAVPTLIFFSAIVLVVGLLARTYREASSMATPVMILPVISMVAGLAEPKISAAILLTPIINTTVIIREVLTGRATFELELVDLVERRGGAERHARAVGHRHDRHPAIAQGDPREGTVVDTSLDVPERGLVHPTG